MEDAIFKKMRVKEGMTGTTLYAPTEYPNYRGFSCESGDKFNFVHLFVTSQIEFSKRFAEAVALVAEDALFWLSYPKSTKGQKYDINRDILWDLLLPLGWHPVSQVSLNETWSAMRLKPNDPDVVYERPRKKK